MWWPFPRVAPILSRGLSAASRRWRQTRSRGERLGRNAQRIGLHGAGNVTVTAAPGAHPVLDGSTLPVPTGRSAMVDIADSTSVTVHGLDITGYRTTAIDAMPIGIYVHGGDSGVSVRGN